ncbi:pyridoxal 5'-phosphate synthase glutaminase subunit PdxT [Corynebacterium striatum]|uniref:pyridoxal 5'-phosphate synthase glutaminase subunit PdxT n=1 Tax=Corynebacterium striatum TaxID=43770 RepID=UPI00062765F6|nr:pyridoxal 5'-phosphate synthase glutaminase subunit PdxT [Corynebacterium striatum]KKO77374.1 glutamine amidotransferase [Corynebacterium striatum]MBD0853883.1 pyridoxal 5'-phosphate synthase glutaminase subunit PdxT [Corynebacterium striatum]MDK8843248.1 pyridoxal 5'-phosphate synthase glutaminase subunit PdxT [Corynebacterium striatum]
MVIGVLALQGGVEEHAAILSSLGAQVRRVRLPRDLDGLDGIVFPGGESSTIDRLARAFDLAAPLRDAVRSGLPVLATCAGLIYSARELENPAAGQQTLGILDVTVKRNAFGNQRFSEERTVTVDGVPVEASFIRAPVVTRVGSGVEVIATIAGDVIVGVRQGHVTALSFHPEENGETRIHETWLNCCLGATSAR